MEVQKSIVAVRQQDLLKSLEIEKLSRSIWYGSRSSVWLAKRMHDTKLTNGCVFYFAASVALYAR